MAVSRRDSFFDPAEGIGPVARAEQQVGRLRAAITAAYERAPAMRARLEQCGLRPEAVRTLEDLAPLPVLRKDSLPRLQAASPPFGGLLGAPVASLRRIYVSPGPIYDPESPGVDSWGLAPALHAAGFRTGDIVLVTFSFHLTPAGHMMDAALAHLGCVVIPGGIGNTEVQARAIADLGATGVIGTPSFVFTLLEKLSALEVRHELALAFVSGEVLPTTLRQRMREEFGVRVSQGYATADVGLIAYECPAEQGLHVSARVLVELLDPDTGSPVASGTPGEVVVSLLDPPYALLRLGTGDLAAAVSGSCPCGRTAPRLAGILGRVGEAVKIRGLFVHPAEADRVALGFPEVVRYQIVVTRPGNHDEATVRLELRPGANAAESAARVGNAFQETLRLRLPVEVVLPGTIEKGAERILDLRTWR